MTVVTRERSRPVIGQQSEKRKNAAQIRGYLARGTWPIFAAVTGLILGLDDLRLLLFCMSLSALLGWGIGHCLAAWLLYDLLRFEEHPATETVTTEKRGPTIEQRNITMNETDTLNIRNVMLTDTMTVTPHMIAKIAEQVRAGRKHVTRSTLGVSGSQYPQWEAAMIGAGWISENPRGMLTPLGFTILDIDSPTPQGDATIPRRSVETTTPTPDGRP